jgi:TetR/AcrR family transcriptional regulator, mexJK operon transcriptional repressor
MQHQTPPKKPRGRPVNEDRRQEIIEIAAHLFMTVGLHATTMEHIARELSISKLTLYSRFKNKEALFAAVIDEKCEHYIPQHLFDGVNTLPAEESLYKLALSFMRLLTSDDAMGIERMLMGLDSKEIKRYTKVFYDAGPLRLKKQMINHLERLSKAKFLMISDPVMATNIFMSMIKGSDICFRVQMCVPPKPSVREMQHYCKSIVALFIKAHRI